MGSLIIIINYIPTRLCEYTLAFQIKKVWAYELMKKPRSKRIRHNVDRIF